MATDMKKYASDSQEKGQMGSSESKSGQDFYSSEMTPEATFESTTGKNVSQVSYRKEKYYETVKK